MVLTKKKVRKKKGFTFSGGKDGHPNGFERSRDYGNGAVEIHLS